MERTFAAAALESFADRADQAGGADPPAPRMLSSGVGGIFSSTLLTLLVLPTLYARFEKEMGS